eukprot:14463249-Alexandrium_andersonii.AAC.1
MPLPNLGGSTAMFDPAFALQTLNGRGGGSPQARESVAQLCAARFEFALGSPAPFKPDRARNGQVRARVRV